MHQHVRGEIHLRTTVEGKGVRIAVYDRSPVPPCSQAKVGEDAEGGRGLVLVEALAHGFGVTKVRDGKGVWFWLAAEDE